MTDDIELLRRYADEGSEEAFTELVRRHLDFVYGTAARLGRNPHRADDIAQAVFCDLARKSRALCRRRDLVGWLYISTHYASTSVIRAEARRAAREQEAARMQLNDQGQSEADWSRLSPVLDAALRQLGELDRDAILQRFFKQRSFGEVGAALGLSEDAAKKRVHRALEKLRPLLARHGITSTAGLAAALTAQTALAAPAGLAASVSGTAIAQVGAGGLGASVSVQFLQLMNTSKAVVGGLVLVGITGVFLAYRISGPAGSPAEPAAGRAIVTSVTSAEFRDSNLSGSTEKIPSDLKGKPPAPTLTEILAMDDPVRAFELFSAHMLVMNPPEFDGAFRTILGIRKPVQQQLFLNLLLKRWGQLDATSAMAAVDSLARAPMADGTWVAPRTVPFYHGLVLAGWVVARPEEAWEWILAESQQEADPDRDFLKSTSGAPISSERFRSEQLRERSRDVLHALVDSNQFEMAGALFARSVLQPADAFGTIFAAKLMQVWVAGDIAGAQRWIDGYVQPGPVRLAAVSGFMQAVAAEAPDLATNFIGALKLPAEINAGSTGALAAFRARADSVGALRWLESTMGDNADGGFDGAIRGYVDLLGSIDVAQPDGSATRELIGRIRDPQQQQAAATRFARDMMTRSPAEAVQAVIRFHPPEILWSGGLGTTSLPNLMQIWAREDPVRAVAFVDGLSAFSETDRARLRGIIEAAQAAKEGTP